MAEIDPSTADKPEPVVDPEDVNTSIEAAAPEEAASGNGTAKDAIGDVVGNSTDDTDEPSDDISYFWNIPCKRYRVVQEIPENKKSSTPMLVYAGDSPPEDHAAVQAFVTDNKLNHGDILAFSEERDSKSFIVCRDADKDEYTVTPNTDDSSAGYLTIPRVVMENVTNSVSKYEAVIRDSVAINLHVSPRDAFLKKKFGDGDIPHAWDFDIHFSYGELEEIYVRTPGADWEAFDAEETTLDDIKDFFESGRHYKTEFTVTVELEGDKLEEYKLKYGDEDDKDAWMQALPEIPPTWKLEKGESSGEDDEYCWEWMLVGPEEDEEEVRESVAHFLRGFEHKFH